MSVIEEIRDRAQSILGERVGIDAVTAVLRAAGIDSCDKLEKVLEIGGEK